jgi:hypothetical protein
MGLLKDLSLLGFVWCLVVPILAGVAPNDGQTVNRSVIMACFAFFMYAIFHSVIGYVQGKKRKQTFLKIVSIVSGVLFANLGLFTLLTGVGIIKGNGAIWTIQDTQNALLGYMGSALPVVIIFSIITLILSSKALKQNTT